MAEEKKEEKQTIKKKKTSSVWKNYEVSGDSIKRKNKSCPKCGAGVFMAEHNDRQSCGSCGYTEMKGKEVKEEKSEK